MRFCIIGLGRFGYQLAVSLAEQGAEVLAIDKNAEVVESIKDNVTQAVALSVTDEESLRAVGIEDMHTVVVSTGEDFAQSVLITALLKKRIKMPFVVARAINTIHEEILLIVGADKVVLPERDMGVRLADMLSIPFLELVPLFGTLAATVIKSPPSFVNKPIHTLSFYKAKKISCVAVKKGDEFVLISPDYVVMPGDEFLWVGERRHLSSLVMM